MKNRNIHYRKTIPALVIALVLGCFLPSPAVQAQSRTIVGLWKVHYFHGTQELFQTFDQWHSDGLEFEVAALGPGAVCQGTFTQTGGTVQLFHTGFNFDQSGVVSGFFRETQTNTVSLDDSRYHGTFDLKNFDMSGNFLSEDSGTLKATRLPAP